METSTPIASHRFGPNTDDQLRRRRDFSEDDSPSVDSGISLSPSQFDISSTDAPVGEATFAKHLKQFKQLNRKKLFPNASTLDSLTAGVVLPIICASLFIITMLLFANLISKADDQVAKGRYLDAISNARNGKLASMYFAKMARLSVVESEQPLDMAMDDVGEPTVDEPMTLRPEANDLPASRSDLQFQLRFDEPNLPPIHDLSREMTHQRLVATKMLPVASRRAKPMRLGLRLPYLEQQQQQQMPQPDLDVDFRDFDESQVKKTAADFSRLDLPTSIQGQQSQQVVGDEQMKDDVDVGGTSDVVDFKRLVAKVGESQR